MTKFYNFNSHAHVERDNFNKDILNLRKISTHTLTWSVTMNCQADAHILNISTHTLTWSVTDTDSIKYLHPDISTHTLTWSVTLDVVYIWCLLNVMRTYFFI